MEDFNTRSQETEAIRAVKILKESLQEANLNLSKWQINFEVEVDADTLDVKVTATKPFGGGGIIKTFSNADVIYFKDDVYGMVNEVVDAVFVMLLKQQMRENLHDPLLLAVKNVLKSTNK